MCSRNCQCSVLTLGTMCPCRLLPLRPVNTRCIREHLQNKTREFFCNYTKLVLKVYIGKRKIISVTRMHSSRMRTARSLMYLRISSYPTHAPPGATMHAPRSNHTRMPPLREQPRMPPPPGATKHAPLGATTHTPSWTDGHL